MVIIERVPGQWFKILTGTGYREMLPILSLCKFRLRCCQMMGCSEVRKINRY